MSETVVFGFKLIDIPKDDADAVAFGVAFLNETVETGFVLQAGESVGFAAVRQLELAFVCLD